MQPPRAIIPQRNVPAGDHVVQRGDTLYSIAWQHGLKVDELARLNRLHAPFTIYPGQRLRIRPGSTPRVRPLARPALLRPAPLPGPKPVPVAPGQAKAAAAPVPAPAPASARLAGAPPYDGQWQWPTRGKLLRGYQENANGKKGIDISGHHGQPVKAAAGGKVVYVGSGLVGYGRLIIVKHNDSLLSAYGHNSKLLVAEGDHVRAGQLIAKMGSSGTSRTALYFEIRKDGKPVDPLRYLPAH
jgi:lipoprotein NlpD